MASKKIIIPALALGALLLTGVLAVNTIKAEEGDWYPPIVRKLVERFNLNEDEVKTVFDEVREERREGRQARFEERLNEAVEEGTITEEQKNAILEKHAEMQQRREQMREEMKAWDEENSLDQFFLGGCRGFRKGF